MSRNVSFARPSGSRADVFDAKLFRAHFDNLPGPAYMWQRVDGEFRLIAHNRAAGELPFSSGAKFIGMRARDLQASNAHDLTEDLERCSCTGEVVHRLIDYRYLDTGAVRRLALTLVPILADTVVAHTDDVTEREETEQALRASEEKYRTIVDAAHEGIWAVDRDSRTTYVNRRGAEMIGYTPEELLGRSIFDLIDESLRDEAMSIRARRHAGVKEQFDFRLRHRNGDGVWVAVTASPITDDQGNVVGAIHLVSDISERKRTEQALRESEAKMRAFLRANPDMIVRVTRDGRYLDVHIPEDEVHSALSQASCTFIGRNANEIFDADFARRHEHYRHKALETGELQLWEYVRQIHGDNRHLEARFMKSGDDEVVITVRDITRRVELEREVITSAERERARIGHDLHDGLAQLLIGVKLLLEALTDKLGADDSPHTADARRAVGLVTHAIEQTGDLARGLSPLRKGDDFHHALEQLAHQSEVLLGASCKVVCCEAPADLHDDTAVHLYRIAQEAITNAMKHGKASRVELRCEPAGKRFLLSIADNGIGLSENTEIRGLGMHTMQYRARIIGGELNVAARSEGGTIVKCYFPASTASAPR